MNVFLGLGLPWVLATMYGLATDKPYKVATGNLTVSVIIFSVLAVVCIAVLILRRKVCTLQNYSEVYNALNYQRYISDTVFCIIPHQDSKYPKLYLSNFIFNDITNIWLFFIRNYTNYISFHCIVHDWLSLQSVDE